MATISSLVLLVACVLPWYTAGGGSGIPAVTGNAFEGAGIIVVLVSLATLALVALPYAAGDVPIGIERWQSFAVLAAAGVVAHIVRLVGLVTSPAGPGSLTPDRAPGLWLAGVALIALSWAAFDLFTVRHGRR